VGGGKEYCRCLSYWRLYFEKVLELRSSWSSLLFYSGEIKKSFALLNIFELTGFVYKLKVHQPCEVIKRVSDRLVKHLQFILFMRILRVSNIQHKPNMEAFKVKLRNRH
jgi:hypothetical protein